MFVFSVSFLRPPTQCMCLIKLYILWSSEPIVELTCYWYLCLTKNDFKMSNIWYSPIVHWMIDLLIARQRFHSDIQIIIIQIIIMTQDHKNSIFIAPRIPTERSVFTITIALGRVVLSVLLSCSDWLPINGRRWIEFKYKTTIMILHNIIKINDISWYCYIVIFSFN